MRRVGHFFEFVSLVMMSKKKKNKLVCQKPENLFSFHAKRCALQPTDIITFNFYSLKVSRAGCLDSRNLFWCVQSNSHSPNAVLMLSGVPSFVLRSPAHLKAKSHHCRFNVSVFSAFIENIRL